MAVRGGAGVGKTYFAASMADAGLGRLCIIDIERKTRLLKGVGSKFDGIEVERPSEVPEFIDWLLNSPEAAAQNYGCYALDSWASYFSAKHSEMIAAVRERAGDPLAQPNAEELDAYISDDGDRSIYKAVSGMLPTTDSHFCEVIEARVAIACTPRGVGIDLVEIRDHGLDRGRDA